MSEKEQRVFILGRVVFVDSQVASPTNNPYGLQLGTAFHVCHVEPVSSARLRRGACA